MITAPCHREPAFPRIPPEVLARIFRFAQHKTLLKLFQTNRECRAISLQEMYVRIKALKWKISSQIQLSEVDRIFNAWVLITSDVPCEFCGTQQIDGSFDCQENAIFGCIVCKSCYEKKIHHERPRLVYSCSGSHTITTRKGTSHDVHIAKGKNNEFSSLQMQMVFGRAPEGRLEAYHRFIDMLWEGSVSQHSKRYTQSEQS